ISFSASVSCGINDSTSVSTPASTSSQIQIIATVNATTIITQRREIIVFVKRDNSRLGFIRFFFSLRFLFTSSVVKKESLLNNSGINKNIPSIKLTIIPIVNILPKSRIIGTGDVYKAIKPRDVAINAVPTAGTIFVIVLSKLFFAFCCLFFSSCIVILLPRQFLCIAVLELYCIINAEADENGKDRHGHHRNWNLEPSHQANRSHNGHENRHERHETPLHLKSKR